MRRDYSDCSTLSFSLFSVSLLSTDCSRVGVESKCLSANAYYSIQQSFEFRFQAAQLFPVHESAPDAVVALLPPFRTDLVPHRNVA